MQTSDNIIVKKRGRKPKKNIYKVDAIEEERTNSHEEKIILHLPLFNIEDNMNQINNSIPDLFIKIPESITDNTDVASTEILNSTMTHSQINKIAIYTLNITSNTKCWWCKNNFDTEAVQLPENYITSVFYCIGHFCSYNCAKSYNLDINDNITYKRTSLINLLYFLIHGKHIDITPAPHWLSLEEYGGFMSISQFRENSIINNKEYVLLFPPLVSRQMQIEESYKINKLSEVSINKINKKYSDIESNSSYAIKRNKPLPNSHLNLDSVNEFIKKKT